MFQLNILFKKTVNKNTGASMEKFIICDEVENLHFSVKRVENVAVLLGMLQHCDLSDVPIENVNNVFGLLQEMLDEAYQVQAAWFVQGIEVC